MGSFVDSRDNEVYQTVTIGTQTWMSENFRGDFGTNLAYDNDTNNIPIYGRLYKGGDEQGGSNTSIVNTIAPAGWHLPTDTEFATLFDFIGGISTASKKLKANSALWNTNTGTDDYGFGLLPTGYYDSTFQTLGIDTFLWCMPLTNNTHTHSTVIFPGGDNSAYNTAFSIVAYLPVRFIKDADIPIITTDITLSNNNVFDGALTNTVIGTITAVGNSPSYTFNVVNSEVFGISGNNLIVLDGSLIDRTTRIIYPIEIEAIDTVNGIFIKSFEITILIDPEASIITFIDSMASPELTTKVIILNGINFTLGGSPVITIDGTIITQLITTDTSITCLIPSLSAGIYTLNVVNGMGK